VRAAIGALANAHAVLLEEFSIESGNWREEDTGNYSLWHNTQKNLQLELIREEKLTRELERGEFNR
jgi:hypothetical protein